MNKRLGLELILREFDGCLVMKQQMNKIQRKINCWQSHCQSLNRLLEFY